MRSRTCRVCANKEIPNIGKWTLLDIPVNYFECPVCGYVQTEEPHWLPRAYSKAINDSDTGIMVRNLTNSRIVIGALWALGKLNGRVIDCAGGYGVLVRLLRDYGIEALWSDRYCQNLMARGFEHNGEQAELVTAFEAFEHFVNPSEELDHLLATAPNVLLSTEIITDPAPTQGEWWYYGRDHGQHIGFFRVRTLEMLARDRGKFLTTNGTSYHLITETPISKNLWKALIWGNKLIPTFIGSRLKPKTWADHEKTKHKMHD